MENSENKFRHGAQVVAKLDPLRALTVRRFVDRIYYCTENAVLNAKDLVYFERELSAHQPDAAPPAGKAARGSEPV